MKIAKAGALAGAVVLVALTSPGAVVHAQSTILSAVEAGRGARIGVSVTTVDAADSKEARAGVSIDTVDPGGPADKAGIKAGDIVTDFDGERVRSVRQFTRLVQETTAGHSVPVVLSRAGQRVTVNITPERAPAMMLGDDFNMRFLETPMARPVTPRPPTPPPAPAAPRIAPMPFDLFSFRNTGRLGITMADLDTQLAEYFGVKDGVLVKSVAADSAAAKAGLKAGDVITAINGRHVYDGSDVTRAINRNESNGDLTIEVTRDKKPLTLKGKLEEADTRVRTRVRTIV